MAQVFVSASAVQTAVSKKKKSSKKVKETLNFWPNDCNFVQQLERRSSNDYCKELVKACEQGIPTGKQRNPAVAEHGQEYMDFDMPASDSDTTPYGSPVVTSILHTNQLFGGDVGGYGSESGASAGEDCDPLLDLSSQAQSGLRCLEKDMMGIGASESSLERASALCDVILAQAQYIHHCIVYGSLANCEALDAASRACDIACEIAMPSPGPSEHQERKTEHVWPHAEGVIEDFGSKSFGDHDFFEGLEKEQELLRRVYYEGLPPWLDVQYDLTENARHEALEITAATMCSLPLHLVAIMKFSAGAAYQFCRGRLTFAAADYLSAFGAVCHLLEDMQSAVKPCVLDASIFSVAALRRRIDAVNVFKLPSASAVLSRWLKPYIPAVNRIPMLARFVRSSSSR